jgi:hypothetical protein
MSRKRHTPEQIIGRLREAEVLLSQGQRTGEGIVRLTGRELADRKMSRPLTRRVDAIQRVRQRGSA